MARIIDYTLSRNDISELQDEELAKYMMFADRDRKIFDVAENIYWMCVEEINNRMDGN